MIIAKTTIHGIGQAQPYPSSSLKFVNYVFGYPFNLIYVSQLVRSLYYSITFTKNSIFMLYHDIMKTIGRGHDSRGPHYLVSSSLVACAMIVPPDLIHNRLGQPNLPKL